MRLTLYPLLHSETKHAREEDFEGELTKTARALQLTFTDKVCAFSGEYTEQACTKKHTVIYELSKEKFPLSLNAKSFERMVHNMLVCGNDMPAVNEM